MDKFRFTVFTSPKDEGTDVFLRYEEDGTVTWVCWMRGKCFLRVGSEDAPPQTEVHITLCDVHPEDCV